jgi:hypothetical protein
LCDSVQPWEHGTVLRCSRHPDWYELNCVRVEQNPGMSAPELIAFADRALGGLSHRLICFEPVPAAMALRAQFHDAGWEVHPLVWMHYQGDGTPPGEPDRVLEVSSTQSLPCATPGTARTSRRLIPPSSMPPCEVNRWRGA